MLNSEAECVHKLNNCEIPLYEQRTTTFDEDDFNMPICERCNEGYFWRESAIDAVSKDLVPGLCEKCGFAIHGCEECSTSKTCLTCANERLVSPSGAKC